MKAGAMKAFLIGVMAAAISLPLLYPALAQTAATPAATAQTPKSEAPKSYAISYGNTPGGIRLAHRRIADEKEQAFSFHWQDRLVQHTPDKAGLMTLGPLLLTVGGAGPFDGGALEEELNDVGGSISLSRGRAYTFGQIQAQRGEIEATAKLLRLILTEPRLAAITLERRKRFILENRLANREKNDALAREAMASIVVGDHPIRATMATAPESSVTSVTVADIQQWQKAIIATNNLTVVAAGPMTREEAADLVDRTFGALPEKAEDKQAIPLTLRPAFAKTIVIEKQVAQTYVLVGGPVSWTSSGAEGLNRSVAMSVLGGGGFQSRLMVAVREKLGAAYGASAGVTTLLGSQGYFAMEAAVAHDKAAAALAAMREEYTKFRETGIAQTDLDAFRRRVAGGMPESMRKAGSAASVIRSALQSGLPFDAPDRQAGWLRDMSIGKINGQIMGRLPVTLTTIVVAPSAAGLAADCVIKSIDELPSCLPQ